jgi:hypothetical protein
MKRDYETHENNETDEKKLRATALELMGSHLPL